MSDSSEHVASIWTPFFTKRLQDIDLAVISDSYGFALYKPTADLLLRELIRTGVLRQGATLEETGILKIIDKTGKPGLKQYISYDVPQIRTALGESQPPQTGVALGGAPPSAHLNQIPRGIALGGTNFVSQIPLHFESSTTTFSGVVHTPRREMSHDPAEILRKRWEWFFNEGYVTESVIRAITTYYGWTLDIAAPGAIRKKMFDKGKLVLGSDVKTMTDLVIQIGRKDLAEEITNRFE